MTKLEIEQLKSSLRIEEVVGRYVKLDRKGISYVGLCPFHEDHHPSLMVNPQKQTFNCFACGEHGDAIGFIQKMEHCTFMSAVGKLKIENGELKINERKVKPVDRNSDAKQLSTVTCQLSTEKNLQFFSSLLPYACGNSELTPAYLDFEVGQSPVNVPKEWYAMRNRIIFPIRNEAGQLIAFAARKLTDDNPDEPKYINTSTANGYKKSENLYALYRAKEAITRQGFVFVVEGYKDAIAMHAAGFTNTVALCGTALTTGQIALLQKYTNRICLLLDGDKPGREAARKISLSLDPVSMEVQTIFLPEGEDPDSLFRRCGKEAFVSRIGRYQAIYQEKEQFGSLYPEAANVMEMFLIRLFFLYAENRILRDIQKQVRLLLETVPENKEKRLAILIHIAKRREQLRHVSENLDRPGAVIVPIR